MRGLRPFGVLALTALLAASSAAAADPSTVGEGMKVTLDYTLRLPDKTVAETTVGDQPVSYVQGKNEILPGLEKKLAGRKTGEELTITLNPEEAYGVYDEKNKVSVPKNRMPPDIEVGTRLVGQDGREAKVAAIQGENVIVDTNHPLAGKTLTFDVHILKVEQAAASAP